MIISLYKYPLSSKNTQKVCETEFFTQFNDIYYFPSEIPEIFSHHSPVWQDSHFIG